MFASRSSSETVRRTPSSPFEMKMSAVDLRGVVVAAAADSTRSLRMRDETSVATPRAMLATISPARSHRWTR
jgi:hypothetical protein